MAYISFRNRKRKIKLLWEESKRQKQEAELLNVNKIIDFNSVSFHKTINDFLVLEDSVLVDPEDTNGNFPAQLYEFAFLNIPNVSLNSAYIIERIFRTSDSQSEIFDKYRQKNFFIKRITDGVIFQVPLESINNQNTTFREIKVYVLNPYEISTIQKTAL